MEELAGMILWLLLRRNDRIKQGGPGFHRSFEAIRMLRCCLLATCLLLASCHYPQVVLPEPVTLDEVVRLSQAETPAQTIIDRIAHSRTIYELDAAEVIRLHEAGVDHAVIDYMLETRRYRVDVHRYYHDPYYGHRYYPVHGYWWSCW